MFTVYAEKEAFENIVLFNEETPNWYYILCNHAEVCLNMTDNELDSELVDGTPIFEYVKANGFRKPKALQNYFEAVYEMPEIISEQPRAAFFLKHDAFEASKLQQQYGVLVQSLDGFDDLSLKGTFFHEFKENDIIEKGEKMGWKQMVRFKLPPANSMVITDKYLFSNEENAQVVGKSNIISLIDAFLPATLDIPFHITIIADDDPEPGKTAKTKKWCEQLAGDLSTAVKKLRPYEIALELVFTKTIHKRRIMLNYLSGSCDKGFALFKACDGKTVRSDNDFRCDRIFNRMRIEEGDSDFHSMELALIELKKKCIGVKQYIGNSGQATQNRILGDCKPDKSITNRLINDV